MESLRSEHACRADGELLRRYLDSRDDVALTELITRHAALVRGVCRRVLGNTPDADDAFQATFLVLVRSGGRILRPQSLAAWLFGVAHRIARRQRRQRGLPIQTVREEHVMVEHDPLAELAARHDISLFDAELARLPEKYRAPIVLHHLEGKSQREVAAELQLTEGAVDGLLKRGRNELRVRLARQGVVFGATLAAVQTSHNAIAAIPPQPLIETTVQGMLLYDPILHPEPIHTPVARLAHQEMSTMALFQVTKVTAWTLVGSLVLGAAGVGVSTARHNPSANSAGVIASELAVADMNSDALAMVTADDTRKSEDVVLDSGLNTRVYPANDLSRLFNSPIKNEDDRRQLLKRIQEIVGGQWQGDDANTSAGTIAIGKDDHIVIRQTSQVHDQIANLLAALRKINGRHPDVSGDYADAPQPPRSHAGEKIAVVGDVDLDGDGKSDREMFHKLLKDAGIELANEVDDAGERTGDKIGEATKFLIVGDIPDSRTKRTAAEREQVHQVMRHFHDLMKEAKASGVRIVSLNDFLDYIGQPKANPIPAPGNPPPKDFRKPSPAEVRIGMALQEPTEISFVETSLKDALEFIEDLHNFQIIIKEAEINADGGSVDQKVNLELSGVSLDSALDLMLEPLELDYVVDKEVMLITTKGNAAKHRELRIYNLHDFKSMFGEVKFDEEAATQRITDAIQKAVAGEWETGGGGGTMSLTPAGLVVRQNQRTHREIENLIDQLRRANEAK